ncbi:hypothetical protein Tco_1405438 [Tanacetum coccineum]
MPSFPSPNPTVSYFNDLDFFKDFEKEFPSIVYNDALTSKLDFLTEPTISPQRIDEFDLKYETSLSKCDEKEQNVLYFNDLFSVNVTGPRCMAWLDYDEHVDSLSTMDNEVGVTSLESTTQTLPSFEEYTPPMTYPKEVEKTLGTPIEPQPLLNSPSLDVSLGDLIGPEPPIKPHSSDISRMKVVYYLTTQTLPSPHVVNSHPKGVYSYYNPCIDDPKRYYGFKPGLLGKSVSLGVDISNWEMFDDDWGLESKEVYPLGKELSLFDRPNEAERGRILEAHHLESILQQQISQCMAPSHHDDDLPTDGYNRNDVERLCARLICLRKMREEVLVHYGLSSVWFNKECDPVFQRIDDNAEMSIYNFMTLPSWGDAKVAEESHHLSSLLLEHVSSHTTAPATEGAMILLPTSNEIVASLSDPRLAKKSKGLSHVRVHLALDTTPEPSQPSKKRKLKKRASEAGSSAPELGTSTRSALAPTLRLGKRLGAPHSKAVVSASGPSHVGDYSSMLVLLGLACELLGAAVSGHAGKSGAEILEDDFGPATCGEEIDLTLFPLTPGSRRPKNALDRTITPAELKRTEYLLPLDLSNRFNVLSALLQGIAIKESLIERLGNVKGSFRFERTTLDVNLKDSKGMLPLLGLSEELSKSDTKLSDQALVVRDLQNQLALKKAKSQGYKDAVDGLREEVTRYSYSSAAEWDLRKFSDIGAWVHVPRCMAWLDYDKHVDSLSTMDNEVGVTTPESTTQTLPSFEKYTPPVTYPKEVEKTLGTPIEVEPLNETKLEEVGLNCNHNTPFSSREVPSFDGPEPQPLPKSSPKSLQVRVHSASDTAPEPSRPKRMKLKKSASKTGYSAPELGQAKGMNEADLTDFYAEIENSLDRDEGTSTRAALAPTPYLGKRLGAPPFMVVVSASGPSHVGTSVNASTSGHSFSLGGAAVSGHAGKFGAKVVWRQMGSLDSLDRSALSRYVEYDQIPEDDFSTATCGEEIDLTLFPLTPEDNILCKDIFKDPNVCRKALDRTITPAKLKRTESLLPLDLTNRFNILNALLVSHRAELNSRYTGLVTARNLLQEKFDRKAGYVKVLRSEVTTLDGKLERMQKDYDALGQENMELHSQKDATSDKVKELQTELTDVRNQLALEKAKSQGYKDVVDGLREEVTRFVGSGVESLVRKLLSSDEFHAALAHVASLGINYGADFDKALVDFPTTRFPFLGKKFAAARGTLPEVNQVLPDKHIRSVTSVPVAPPIANEDVNQVPLEHASDDSTASI